jgi:endonuclease/exonuclease/phosphatase (EEP) superfamily protein YafD
VVRLVGPELDLVAVGLPALAGLGILVYLAIAAARSRPGYVLSAASMVLFAIVSTLGPRLPHPTPAPVDPFLLVSANTFDQNPTPGAAVRSLAALHPDILVAVETDEAIEHGLADAFGGYAHDMGGRLEVYSRWPLRSGRRLPGIPKAVAFRVTVDRPGGSVIVVAIHLPNPLHEISFPDHLAMVRRILAEVRDLPHPVILAGDFNTSDRTDAYRVMAGDMRDAIRSSWPSRTYVGGLFGLLELRIDHVLEPEDWCSQDAVTVPVEGSDHRGLVVRLGPCPP